MILKCDIGNTKGRFWRFGGISTFKELFSSLFSSPEPLGSQGELIGWP